MPTILIAVPPEERPHLERSFFWRSDMRRTFSSPGAVVNVARTLGPDVIIVMSDAMPTVQATVDEIRQDAATRDSVVVILTRSLPDVTAAFQEGGSLILPYDFDATDVETAPWHERMEALLSVRSRRDTRVPAEFDVDIWLGEGADRRQGSARAMNLSSRGILLAVSEPIEVGIRLDIGFAAAEGLPRVSVIGEIVRRAEMADGRWLAGVHFVVVRKDSRLAIRDSLRALRPEAAVEDGDRGGEPAPA